MAHKYQVPHIYIAGISAMEFLTTKLSPWVRHANYGGVIHEYAVVLYMTKEKKLKKIISMVPDYAWGWSMEDCIKGVAKNYGAQVIQAMRTAFPTMDFSPYIAKFNKDADAIYVGYTGADAQRFVKQAKQLGVNISNVWSSSVFMPGLIEDIGLDAIGGHGGNVWLPGVDNPESKAFMKAYKKKFKEDPGMQAAVSHTCMLATIKILKGIAGNVEDKRAFLDGWYNLGTIKSPIGNFGYEKSTESGIQSMYMYEIIEKDKKPYHKIVAEYPNMKSSDMLKAMGLMK
jgi:branched-chain amino acid transport system substrate-binding protein